jgi:DNA invertase Pin-like site-specific DNA recombinase
MDKRVAVYARVSKAERNDPTSIPVQLADCREYASEQGWEVVAEFTDEGKSGWDPRVKRRGWEDALEALTTGQVEAILARDFERLLRQDKEGQRLLDLHTQGGAVFWPFTDEGDLDLRRARDRKDLKERVAAAVYYSERLQEKVRKGKRHLREQGLNQGGGRRPFGWRARGKRSHAFDPVPEEQARIREAVDRIIAGHTTHRVCLDWNAQGVTTAYGGRWKPANLRKLLISDHLAGTNGFAALVTPEELAAVRSRLNWREKLKPGRPCEPRHPLSGLVWCGRCAESGLKVKMGGAGQRYICQNCGSTVKAAPVEVHVALDTAERRSEFGAREPRQPAQTVDTAPIARELHEVKARLEALAKDIDIPDWLVPIRARALEARRQELDDQLSEAVLAHLPVPPVPLSDEWWKRVGETYLRMEGHQLTPQEAAELRDWFRFYIEAVTIAPVGRGKPFDAGRVRITWRD